MGKEPKKFWEKINLVLPSKDSAAQINILNQDNNTQVHQKDLPDFFNTYFSLTGCKLAEKFQDPWKSNMKKSDYEMINLITNEAEVERVIKEIDISKSSAIPNLSSRVLKDSLQCLVTQLTYLFN